MKCPYITSTIDTEQPQAPEIIEFIPNDDRIQPIAMWANAIVRTVTTVMTDCIEKECAAWHDGRCCYNGK